MLQNQALPNSKHKKKHITRTQLNSCQCISLFHWSINVSKSTSHTQNWDFSQPVTLTHLPRYQETPGIDLHHTNHHRIGLGHDLRWPWPVDVESECFPLYTWPTWTQRVPKKRGVSTRWLIWINGKTTKLEVVDSLKKKRVANSTPPKK